MGINNKLRRKIKKKKKEASKRRPTNDSPNNNNWDLLKTLGIDLPVKPKTEQEKLDWLGRISPNVPILLSDVHCEFPAMACFMNCLYVATVRSLKIVLGWIIWDETYLEAECHAVCYDEKTDTYFDVTKRVDKEKEVLFIPDETLSVSIKGNEVIRYRNILFPKDSKVKNTAFVNPNPFFADTLIFGKDEKLIEIGTEELKKLEDYFFVANNLS